METQEEKLIFENFRLLKELGYSLSVIEVVNRFNNEIFHQLNFEAKSNCIEVIYSNYSNGQEITLNITKKGKNKVIILSDLWILLKKDPDELLSTPGESPEDYIKRFCKIVEEVFREHLMDTLTGKDWLEVPINYAPYKQLSEETAKANKRKVCNLALKLFARCKQYEQVCKSLKLLGLDFSLIKTV